MNFVILAGSFHNNSKTQLMVEQVIALLPPHACSQAAINNLPFYDPNMEQNKPTPLLNFLDQVTTADGLICITPEYNHSIPAVLKNAIDWASRPAFASPMKDKPVCIISQADSPVGGARAQAHLKLVLDATLALIQPSHEMMIGQIDSLFDQAGTLCDAKVLSRLQHHVEHFVHFVKQCEQTHNHAD